MAFNPNQTFNRFDIGFTIKYGKKECYWTNIAVDHVNGKMTNEKLLKMSDDELKQLVFLNKDTVLLEEYIRPNDKDIADQQGGKKGEIYEAPHRGVVVLQYCDAINENRGPVSEEQQRRNSEALNKVREEFLSKR